MSSWYVFSALGMYPETPGTADLALGSPLFTQAIVTLPSGNTLTINAPAAADNAPYMQSATWNGAAWNNAYVPTSAICGRRHAGLHPGHDGEHVVGHRGVVGTAVLRRRTLPHLGPITSALAGKCVDISAAAARPTARTSSCGRATGPARRSGHWSATAHCRRRAAVWT